MIQKRFNGRERRTYVRLQKSLPVRFKIEESQASQIYEATTRNISHGGLCLEIAKEIEGLLEKISVPGHKIGIDIDSLIPDLTTAASTKSVWVSSRVDWSHKNRKEQNLIIGVEFGDLAEEIRRRIHDFIVKEMVNRYEKSD